MNVQKQSIKEQNKEGEEWPTIGQFHKVPKFEFNFKKGLQRNGTYTENEINKEIFTGQVN